VCKSEEDLIALSVVLFCCRSEIAHPQSERIGYAKNP
jgi:hypothetical protein